jgi:hypothetical protein
MCVGTLVLALAVSLLGSLQTGPAVTMDLLSCTNSTVTVRLVNHGRVPVVCQRVGRAWGLGPAWGVETVQSCPAFTIESRSKREIVAEPWWGLEPLPFPVPIGGRFDVRCRPVRGTLRNRIDQLLSKAGFRSTNGSFVVSVTIPGNDAEFTADQLRQLIEAIERTLAHQRYVHRLPPLPK